jgi:hypothetical protein
LPEPPRATRGGRREQEAAADDEAVQPDWILGSKRFRQELLAAAGIGLHLDAQAQKVTSEER